MTRQQPIRGSNRGFTLVELLVVIAVMSILAAMLFPVFASARDHARRGACSSNLRQLGLGFMQYAADYDSRYPTPGGRSQRMVAGGPSASPGNGWVQSAGPGLGQDVGGIWPYIKQRGNGGAGNVYGCPNAIPGTSAAYSPGQTYAMNDYLRAQHPGQAAGSGRVVPGYFVGMGQDAPQSSSELILLYEAVQASDGSVARNGGVYFIQAGVSRYGLSGLPSNVPEEYHGGGCNFLFCDGHVKWMRPTATWTTATQNSVPAAYANFGSGRSGSAPTDLWNPQLSGVIYP